MRLFTLSPSGYLGRALQQQYHVQPPPAGEEGEVEVDAGHQIVGPEKDAALSDIQSQLVQCDGAILDLSDVSRSADLLSLLAHIQTYDFQSPFILIGVSTVLTWNATSKSSKKTNKESNWRQRKCSPRYKQVRLLETTLLATARDGLVQSMVVAPGVLYGNGEDALHYLFAQAWLHAGDDSFTGLPLIGDGKNLIPTIHIFDLCTILRTLLESPPMDQNYFIAVDSGHTTQKQLIQSIANGLNDGKVKNIDKMDEKVLMAASVAAAGEEVTGGDGLNGAAAAAAPLDPSVASSVTALTSITNGNPELILCDMKFESEFLSGLTIEWHCENGPATAEGFELVREEYVKQRNLRPVRIMMSGPPASGKTFFCQRLTKHYYIPHVQVEAVIQHALQQKDELAERVAAALNDAAAQAAKNSKKAKKGKDKAPGSSAQPGKGKKGSSSNVVPSGPPDWSQWETDAPRLSPYLLSKVVKAYVRRPVCRNKGFILDGFPRTIEESRFFFSPDLEEDENGEPIGKIEDKRADAMLAAEAAALEDEELDEEAAGLNEPLEPQPRDPTTMVDSIIVLSCSEELAAERTKHLAPESIVAGHNDEEGFQRRWNRWCAIVELNPTTGQPAPISESHYSPLAFIQDSVEVLDVPESVAASPDVAKTLQLLTLYANKKGVAYNYHPTPEEQAETEKKEATKKAQQDAADAADAAAKASAEAAQRKHHETNESLRRAAVLLEDRLLLDASALPIRDYLLDNVIPALVDGLLDVCKLQPEDPVDHLAEYLFNYSVDQPKDTDNAQERPTP